MKTYKRNGNRSKKILAELRTAAKRRGIYKPIQIQLPADFIEI